jgi:hypothetical protein
MANSALCPKRTFISIAYFSQLAAISGLNRMYRQISVEVGNKFLTLVRSQLVSVDFSLTQNPSDRTMDLGLTQPLTEMSTRSISWG